MRHHSRARPPGYGPLLWHRRSSSLHEGVLDGPNQLMREDWASIHGSRNGILPSLEHFFHLLPYVVIDNGI